MLSSSIETQVRGDEATRCGQLSQFRAMRLPTGNNDNRRKRRHVSPKSNFIGDIEMMDGL